MLCYACEIGDYGMAKRCIKNGENVNQRETCNPVLERSMLAIAAGKGHLKICQLLMKHGADPDIGDLIGTTPLHMAASRGYTEICRILLDGGADVDPVRKYGGETPLHFAGQRCKLSTCALLIERGANLYAKDVCSTPALHYVVQAMKCRAAAS